MEEGKRLVGRITHYYNKIGVAVIELEDDLCVGDRVSIEGKTTGAVEQTVESMQIEHENVDSARAGQSIGLKVNERVHKHDLVYKLE